jgi:hypothetical protein
MIKPDFYGVDFRGTKLGALNFTGGNLAKARFEGCDLSRVDLKDASLRNSTYDRHTIWPRGFDPDQAGAINMGQSEETVPPGA